MKDVLALLNLDFFPPLDKFLIHCEEGHSPRTTLADSLERVESAGNDVAAKVNTPFDNSYGSFDRSLNEPFSWLVDDLPNSFAYKLDEHIGIPHDIDGPQHLINAFDELFQVEL